MDNTKKHSLIYVINRGGFTQGPGWAHQIFKNIYIYIMYGINIFKWKGSLSENISLCINIFMGISWLISLLQ